MLGFELAMWVADEWQPNVCMLPL